MATNEAPTRPFELWRAEDLKVLRASLWAEKENTARQISCIFWSMTKFQLGEIDGMLVKAIEEAEQERRMRSKPTLIFNVRDVIREDGLFLPPSERGIKIPSTVADIRTPVTEWTSATEIRDLQSLLKEIVVTVLSNAERSLEEEKRARSTGVSFTAEQVPGLVESIDREIELCKRQAEVYDLMRFVRIIATFTTVAQHRQFFQHVMYQVDQIDRRRGRYYKALCLHNDRLEEARRQREAIEEKERKRMAIEEAKEAYRRDELARFCLNL